MDQNILPIILVSLVFLLHYIFFNFETGIIQYLFQNRKTNLLLVITSRITGFLLFYFIPYICSLSTTLIITSSSSLKPINFIIILFISFIPIVINYFEARTTENLKTYPQIRVAEWKIPIIIISSVTWILYLIGYEYMLRYYLFYSMLQHYSLFHAILINILIYAFMHLHKGLKEVVGSLFMGIFICYAVYFTGTFWIAVWFHALLALSNEWFSIYYSNHLKSNE